VSRRLLLALLALALLAAAATAAWRMRSPSMPAFVVQPAPLVRSLQFSGRVATAQRVELGSTLTGRVRSVAAAEGARVQAGDVLLRLEDDELRAALDQALAGEQQAAARLAGLRSSGRSAAQAGVAQAGSVLAAARAELQRTRELLAQGFVSPARLDEARRAEAVAQAQLDAALAQREANAEPGTDTAQAQAQLTLARAAVAAARARLAQATLSAPAAGTVLLRAVEPGQIVQPGRALLHLALAGPVQLVAPVDERFLQQLQVGQTADVVADAYPDQRFAARVLSIGPLVDAQRGAVEVKFSLAGLPAAVRELLREDMTLSISVETGRRDSALVLPLAALRGPADPAAGTAAAGAAASGDTATVWVLQDGRAQPRLVRLGLRTLDAAEVLQGLAAGDTVLLGSGAAPGQKVRADTSAGRPPLDGSARAAGESAAAALTGAMGR
jgi:HlyD family secretion protein